MYQCIWNVAFKSDLQLPVQSVPITTKVVSSNPVQGEVYSIQHYLIKLQWLVTGRWFSPGTPFSSSDKTDCHDIIELLLKRALNTITLTLNCFKKVIKRVIFWCSFITCFRTGWKWNLLSSPIHLECCFPKWSFFSMTLKIKVKCVLIHLSIMLLDTQNWRVHN